MAEGGTLLRCYTGNRIEGSNPSLSAILLREKVMGHSVDDVYRLVSVMYDKAIELHRMRYSSEVGGKYSEQEVQFLIDDLRSLARQLANDRNIDHKLP